MKAEGRFRIIFQWLLSMLLVLTIIHIVSFVWMHPAFSPSHVEVETVISSALSREVLCREAFLSGAEPRPTKRQQVRISPTLQNTWSENKCDQLFCINAGAAYTKDDSVEPCQWSHFAIESLIPKQRDYQTCDEAHVNEFYMDPKWEHYAFSDYFRGIMYRKSHSDSWKDFNKTVFPAGSLMEDYHKASVQRGSGPNNFALLCQIIEKRKAQLPQHLRPEPNTLLIHLRIGDTVDCAVDSVQELLFQQCYYYRGRQDAKRYNNLCITPGVKRPNDQPLKTDWNKYVLPLSHYSKLGLNVRYTSVVIMASAHQAEFKYTRNATNSCLYTVSLRNYFQRFNMSVIMRLAHPPDEDMIFASQVAGFVQGGGGYSRIMGRLVQESGGTVYSIS